MRRALASLLVVLSIAGIPRWSPLHPPVAAAAAVSDTTQSKPSSAESWNVSRPMGPSYDATLDVREGTWMSVDVSPDGRAIAFDLLGDLYEIPIAGGEAHALTHGVEWDEQPRYSPDGRKIAFTSDRGGGDNIWIIERDGSKPRAVSKEKFRLLNSPTWTPDGQFLAARKHFTSTRSAGAGEIWLYHWTGGEGLPMTKRPNQQKDLGEPAFSPDGRFLYYSQDVTPGGTFLYNKDPNAGIYAIRKLERASGETTTLAGGPGGAIRPTPSHDGKWVAFIRRVRNHSMIYLVDPLSGVERALCDGLDRDLQEIWAIHGVYPGMAWTPDDRALVFWAGGKIRRVEVASGTISEIPFHVSGTRRIQEALRFPIAVAPPTWHTRMLRWSTVSPRGDQVVFQALGHLYIRGLPDGTPRRLTRQSDHFEFYPSWSRDGRSIVYVAWDDQKLGSIRIVSAGGGEGRVVTRHPGHYLEPVFTPDGVRVVYRAAAGGGLVSPAWSGESGIYWLPAAGGESHRVTRRGLAPQFGASSERVYLTEVGGEDDDDRTLFSVELDGSDERKHAHGTYFTEARVSPDEKWIAFREKFMAHVAPLVRTGLDAEEIAPGGGALPLRQVSREAGEFLHWSGDGRKLHWSLGPQLYTRDLRDLFTFVPGAPESLPRTPPRGIDIGFDFPTDAPAGRIALTGARIVTMKGDEVIPDGTVLVEGSRIAAVGPRARVEIPAGTRVVDVSGKTIIPGLIDVHWHGGMGADQITPEQSWVNDASLTFGVTTLHDPSNDTGEIFAASELGRAGLITAPRIFSTGLILYGAKGDIKSEIDSLGDARMHLRRMKAVGAFSVKSYNQPRRDQRQQVIQAARELGMMVVPEGGALFPHNMTMIVDGHTGIEHAIPLARMYDDVTQLWKQSRTGYTPTLGVAYGGLWGENYWYAKTNVWEDARLLTFVPRSYIDARSRRRAVAPEEEWNHIEAARQATRLHDAGVAVQVGAHGQREGLAVHWELWSLVLGGMAPLEALRCGTLGGARYLGLERDLGSLERGKLADLAVLDKDPLEDIRNTHDVRYTMVGGRLYDAATMSELLPRARAREPFWFEAEQRALEKVWKPR